MTQEVNYQPRSRVKQDVLASAYTIKFDNDFAEPYNYDDAMEVLECATPNDQIVIKLNSAGGDASTLTMILDAMKNCQAPIHGKIEGKCHSAASFIAMHCDSLEVVEGATSIVHTIQTGWVDHAGGMKKYSDHVYEQAESMVRDAYTGFLEESEILEVLSGVELPFNTKQIRERWEIRQEYLSTQEEPLTEEEKCMYLPLIISQFVEAAETLEMTPIELMMYVKDTLEITSAESEEPPTETIDIYTTEDLDALKELALSIGCYFPHNIGLETLRKKVIGKVDNVS